MKTRLHYLHLIDYIPLAVLYVYAIILLTKIFTSDVIISWRHLTGAIALGITTFLFFKNHKAGVLALGATLLLATVSAVTFVSPVTITTYYVTQNEIPIFYGQPVFLLWFLLHCLCSIRHYIGIGTKEYWQQFNTEKKLQ